MTKKEFKKLITENTGLTNAEYDDIVFALKKYDVDIEQAASHLDVSPGLAGLAIPDTSNKDVAYTSQDKILAEKLDVDVEAVSKFTTWAEAFGKTIDKVDNLPFGIGDKITETLEANGLTEYIGPNTTKADIAGSINSAIDAYETTHRIEHTTPEGATQQATVEQSHKHVENRNEAANDNGFAYQDLENGYRLVAKGDKMEVYDLNGESNWFGKNDAEPKLVATVDCPVNAREEFVSEFKEREGDIPERGFSRNFVISGIAKDVSKEIAEEREFSTGGWFTDAARDAAKEKEEDLTEKLAKLNERLDSLDGTGWFSNSMRESLEQMIGETQVQLDECHKTLEKFEAMEVENAKEMKLKLEATQQGLQDELAALQNAETTSSLQGILNKMQINAITKELDEVGDKLAVIDEKIATAPTTDASTEDNKAIETLNKFNSIFNKLDDAIGNTYNTIDDKIDDVVSDAKAGVKNFIVRVDTLVNDFKDDVVAWGESIQNSSVVTAVVGTAKDAAEAVSKNEDVKDFVSSVKGVVDSVNEKLEPVVDFVKDIGTNIKETVNEKIDDVKEAIDDAKSWVNDKLNAFKNFFSKDDDIEMDIDD